MKPLDIVEEKKTWKNNPDKVAINNYGNEVAFVACLYVEKKIGIKTRDKRWLKSGEKLYLYFHPTGERGKK